MTQRRRGTDIIKRLVTRIRKPLLRSEILFPELSRASPAPILIADTKARIFYVNPAWEKLTGYNFKEVKGKNPRFLQSGKTPKRVFKKLWQTLLKGEPFTTEEIIDRRKDGTKYQTYSIFFVIRRNDKAMFYVQLQHDITERMRLLKIIHEKEEMLRLIIDNAVGYAMYMLDKHGLIVSWNSGVDRLIGFTGEETIGKHVSMFYTKDDCLKRKPWKLLAKAAKKGLYEEEVLQVKKNGTNFWAHITLSAVFSKRGALKGFVQIIRNITVERELDRQKDAFIGIASHELKTPITTLSAYTQILEKRLKDDKKNLYFITNIKAQTDRLVSLIDDLLNVSRIDSGKLELNLKEFDLNTLIKKVVVDFQYTTDIHAITEDGILQNKVIGDETLIEQVIINLLTNAIKYSPKANKIALHLSAKQNQAIVAVQDFGIGIAKKDLPKVFQRFYRIRDIEKGRVSGFGLGLYISSEIIKKHGGKIWIESEQGKGSTFYFTLPLAKTHSAYNSSTHN